MILLKNNANNFTVMVIGRSGLIDEMNMFTLIFSEKNSMMNYKKLLEVQMPVSMDGVGTEDLSWDGKE